MTDMVVGKALIVGGGLVAIGLIIAGLREYVLLTLIPVFVGGWFHFKAFRDARRRMKIADEAYRSTFCDIDRIH